MLNFRNTNIASIIALSVLIFLDWRIDISGWYYVLLITCYIALQSYGSIFVSASFFVPIKCHGSRESQAVAITFDDGPLPVMTAEILDILQDYKAPATFFCIGNRIQKHPEILAKIHSEGHLVCNHTFTHGKFFDLQSATQMTLELKQTDAEIEKAIGLKPRFFRPPYGVTNPNLAAAIRRGGYVTMGWSVRSLDTVTKDDKKLFDRVTKKLQAGDVILFHDYCDITIRILPQVLEHIKKLGLKVVRLDALMNEKPYA